MRQKYLVGKNSNTETIVREMAELEKNEFSVICEKTYKTSELKKAVEAGKKGETGSEPLILQIRQPDFFPPYPVAEKISTAIKESLDSGGDEWVEVLLDELECSREAEAELTDLDEDLDEESDIEELLEDDLDLSPSEEAEDLDNDDEDDA